MGYHHPMDETPGPGLRWFMPFALLLAILTLPLALYDPLVAAPFILAAGGVAAGVWHVERPAGIAGMLLFAPVAVLVVLGTILLAVGMR